LARAAIWQMRFQNSHRFNTSTVNSFFTQSGQTRTLFDVMFALIPPTREKSACYQQQNVNILQNKNGIGSLPASAGAYIVSDIALRGNNSLIYDTTIPLVQ